jgi:hypothetical protein
MAEAEITPGVAMLSTGELSIEFERTFAVVSMSIRNGGE